MHLKKLKLGRYNDTAEYASKIKQEMKFIEVDEDTQGKVIKTVVQQLISRNIW